MNIAVIILWLTAIVVGVANMQKKWVADQTLIYAYLSQLQTVFFSWLKQNNLWQILATAFHYIRADD